jgi:hypothetical protein
LHGRESPIIRSAVPTVGSIPIDLRRAVHLDDRDLHTVTHGHPDSSEETNTELLITGRARNLRRCAGLNPCGGSNCIYTDELDALIGPLVTAINATLMGLSRVSADVAGQLLVRRRRRPECLGRADRQG